jgi:hypothetical protein
VKILKVVSGGQTGVDQAALQVAIDLGIDHGGWCPPGRICENGIIPSYFDLSETPVECDPTAPDIPRSQRTFWNIRDSDGALIFSDGTKLQSDRGTKLAIETSKKLGKPYFVIDLNAEIDLNKVKEWMRKFEIEILSVGGPSENTSPGVYQKAYQLLRKLFVIR